MASASIIIPSHNRGELLMQTIASVRAQTNGDFECIIVDDHSTDDTRERIAPVLRDDSRFSLITVPEGRRGAQAARNVGIERSAGQYLMLLDSDDLIAPHCVEQRLSAVHANPPLDFAVFPCECFRKTPGDVGCLWNVPTNETDLTRFLKLDVPWQTTSPLWKREPIVALLPWPENVPVAQDWEFHIRALAKGLKYARFGTPDHYWRMAESERESIGKNSFKPELLRARVGVNEQVLQTIKDAGLLSDEYCQLFAGLFWQSAERVAQRASRNEGCAVWKKALSLGLITQKQFKDGWNYLKLSRFELIRDHLRSKLEKAWPAAFFAKRSPTYLKAIGESPTISVVMSAYNGASYLRESVDSILAQTYRNFELIVIDDGSKDNTLAILRDYEKRDSRVRVVSRANKGLTVSLNEGLALARGEFVARMDGDDVAKPERFEKQLAYLLANPECVLLGSRVDLIDSFGGFIALGDYMKLSHDEIDADLLKGRGGSVVHPSAMMRTQVLRDLGGYREQFNNSEDLDLFLRLAEVGKVANLPDVLLKYRRHPDSVSHQKYENQWKLKRQIVAEAHARRGLTFPDDWAFNPWQPKPVDVQFREWGWAQLKAGKKQLARQHAWAAMKVSPRSGASWKLLLCALRGR